MDRIDPAHLAGPDADHPSILGQDDGVTLNVFADHPGEAEIGEFLSTGSTLRRDLHLRQFIRPSKIPCMHEQTPVYSAKIIAGGPIPALIGQRARLEKPNILLP